jgi:lauroyl/myristoyl acyltransferase
VVMYRAIRANQAVIRNWSYEDERLHDVVREVLTNAAYGLVDWFATLAISSEFENLRCTIDEELIEAAYRSQAEGRGVIIVGAHLSSFNMFLMKIAQQSLPVQVLSYAEEEGSYKSDNVFRKKFGLDVTPISPSSLRQAYFRLISGGFVLTGVDRPDTGGEELYFFGRSTTLPIGHARLALRTKARIMVVAIQKASSGSYHVSGSRLIEPVSTDDEQGDAHKLAQQIIDYLEKFIRERPSEWMMFIPVWPEVLPNRS